MEKKSRHTIDVPLKLSYKFLGEITNSFSVERKIGSGAFGEVYKGVHKDGKVIAVKRLRWLAGISDNQFENEFGHLKRLKHPNIVQLVGFCDETEDVVVQYEGKLIRALAIHRALCLEFVPNGSLGRFLSEKYLGLSWPMCFKIIKGICEGLKYLHEESVMHFDLKPDNILLDEKMVPRIADFGLSRLLGKENTMCTLTPLGTCGFLPPEFINKQIISKKHDIFSLGVIIKRILTGAMDYFSVADMENDECIEHVHKNWNKRLQDIPGYASLEVHTEQVRTCIEIAVACMETDRHRRPTMNDIVCKLNEVESRKTNSRSSQIEQSILLKRVLPERPSTDDSQNLQMVYHAPFNGDEHAEPARGLCAMIYGRGFSAWQKYLHRFTFFFDALQRILQPIAEAPAAMPVRQVRPERREEAQAAQPIAEAPERRGRRGPGRGMRLRREQDLWDQRDEDEFRRRVEAFIAKQVRFHREANDAAAV